MAPKKRNPIERFNEKTRQLDNGCIEWIAWVGTNGYGRFYYNGKGALAHRWSYEFHVGVIPDGLVIDHLCRNRACVNPAHLEPVTISENVLRGVSPQVSAERFRAITHCPQGHAYTPENTYMRGHGRSCTTCKRASAQAAYKRDRELVIERSRKWRLANIERSRELARQAQVRYRTRKSMEAVK